VDYLLNAQTSAVLGGAYDPSTMSSLSPLNIIATSASTDQQLMQFFDPDDNPTWYVNQEFDGKTLGLNIGEVTAAGKSVDNRLFIQPTQTSSSAPSKQNVGIGSSTPRNPLAIRAQGSWEELLSFENTTGATNWHFNQNPQATGVSRGLNLCETQVNANFRLFVQEGGNVGIGTGTPEQNLTVNTGLNIDEADSNSGTLTHGACPALTFGSASGEGIGSCRQGSSNLHGLDFYTGFQKQLSIDNSGNVTIGGNLSVAGAITSPNKTGCVEDRFINRDNIPLERGDVVIVHFTPSSQFYGAAGQIPLVEVQLTDVAMDTRVCGVVDEPELTGSRTSDLNLAKIGGLKVGVMVTLGAFAHCKVDADIASVVPGDLLVTSPTRGHAQKLNPDAPPKPGAIIGKALGALASGKGTIPVIISHQ
jgi:hypothetical protein